MVNITRLSRVLWQTPNRGDNHQNDLVFCDIHHVLPFNGQPDVPSGTLPARVSLLHLQDDYLSLLDSHMFNEHCSSSIYKSLMYYCPLMMSQISFFSFLIVALLARVFDSFMHYPLVLSPFSPQRKLLNTKVFDSFIYFHFVFSKTTLCSCLK